MSTYCYGAGAQGFQHCWHETGMLLLVNPPLRAEHCCWCNEARTMPAVREVTESAHGKYQFTKKEHA